MEVCYRHPDRETGVACSACGRPNWADCMTSTPAGMRCPECAGQRTVTQRVRGLSAAGAPVATYSLIAANVVAFIAEVSGGGSSAAGAGGSAIQNAGLYGPAIADQGEWWRIVSAGFLHAGPLHLFINMFALYVLGRSWSRPLVLALQRHLLRVVLAGPFGPLPLSPNEHTVGASGAIGIMAATFVVAQGGASIRSSGRFWIVINIAFTLGVASRSAATSAG